MLQVCSPVFLFKINVYYGREYRLLIDVGKFAVYQTDGFFFFFASSLPLMLWGEDGVGRALNLLVLPGCTAAGQPARPGSELLLQLSEIPRKRVKGGDPRRVVAHGIHDFTSAVCCNISLFLCPAGLALGAREKSPKDSIFDALLLSWVVLCKPATAL